MAPNAALETLTWRAGERAPAGRYARVDVGWAPILVLERDDYLPASLDGRVAIYRRLTFVPPRRLTSREPHSALADRATAG